MNFKRCTNMEEVEENISGCSSIKDVGVSGRP
jgi:hypothetical protein